MHDIVKKITKYCAKSQKYQYMIDKKVNNNIIEYITFIKLIKRGIYYGKSLQLQRRPVNIT